MGNNGTKSSSLESKENKTSLTHDEESCMETGSLVFSFNVHISQLKDSNARKEQWINFIEKAEGFNLKIPDFPNSDKNTQVGWINTPHNMDLSVDSHLKGKIVLIDFWTYCCINCIHMIPKLHELELKYKDHPEFAVLGIHTPKFENEKLLKNVANASKRFQIHHPVYNDPKKFMGKAMGYGGWPTLAVVNPKGQLMAIVVGASRYEVHEIGDISRLPEIEELIQVMMEYYQNFPELNQVKPASIVFPSQAVTSLQFPSAVACDALLRRIFISDSGNNRVLVSDFSGTVLEIIGDFSGTSGFQDGLFDEARFHYPIGIAFDSQENCLFVCDSENHAIRKIDLNKRTVITIAGTGKRGFDYKGGKRGGEQELSTPWDCVLLESKENSKLLLFSMPGTHQIWVHEIKEGISHVVSGTGAESHFNSEPALKAQWAQPSGICFSRDRLELFICDSESSSIRSIQFTKDKPIDAENKQHEDMKKAIAALISPFHAKKTQTLVGANENIPQDLELFGDTDGIGNKARLQHPLGIAELIGGLLLISDSYNHKLKLVDPDKNTVTSVNMPSNANSTFNEPHGIAVLSENSVLVADTNNHRLLKAKIDIKKHAVTELEPFNLSFDKIQIENNSNLIEYDTEEFQEDEIQGQAEDSKTISKSVKLQQGLNSIRLSVQGILPKDCHITEGAPSKIVFKNLEQEGMQMVYGDTQANGNFIRIPKQSIALSHENGEVEITVSVQENIPKKFSLKADVKLYFCDEAEACHADNTTLELCFQVNAKSNLSAHQNQVIDFTWHPKKTEL